jgi:hypothetical protein
MLPTIVGNSSRNKTETKVLVQSRHRSQGSSYHPRQSTRRTNIPFGKPSSLPQKGESANVRHARFTLMHHPGKPNELPSRRFFFVYVEPGKRLPSSPHVGRSFAEQFLLEHRCFGVDPVSRSTASTRCLHTT